MPVKSLNIPLPVKGLVVDRPGEFIDAQSHSANKNVRVKRNVVENRPGTDSVGSSLEERVQRIFELETEDGNTHLIRVGITKVEKLNKTTNVWGSIAHAVLTGIATNQVDYAFPLLSGDRIVVFTNGVDAIRKYTGTGNDADLGGSPPKCKFMESFGGYLVLANITDDGSGNARPYRVQWSDTALIETWTGGNSGNTNLLLDKGEITGLKSWGNFLTVHKPDSIYVGQIISTANIFRFDRKATGIGSVSGKAIITIPTGEQAFLGSDGLHLFNGITAPLIPSPVQEELRDSINAENMHKSEAIIKEEDDEVWFAIPMGSSSEPDTIYRFNYRTGEVYKDIRTNVTTFGLFLSTDERTWDDLVGTWDEQTWRWDDRILGAAQPQVLIGDTSGVTVQVSTGVDDNGVAVDSQMETKDFTAQDLGEPEFGTMVRWMEIQIWAKGSDIKVEYSINSGSSWTEIDDIELGSDYPTDDDPDVLYFDVLSSKIRFRYSKDGLGESFTLKKYYIEGSPRERRK